METVVSPIIEPDTAAIKSHLEALFLPARDQYPDGLIEICHGQDKPDHATYFGMKDERIADAVAFAARCNREGQNVYVGVNPRKGSMDIRRRSSDKDVEIAFFHFADLDREEAVVKARENLALRPTMIVMTGTVPNNRPHFYWQLEDPIGNMAAWTEAQRGIAQTLDGDAVINPARIMRLGGTVNYPTQQKLGRGYRMELTNVRTDFASERGPVTPEMIAQAFPPRQQMVEAQAQSIATGETTLSAMANRTRVADLIAACRAGDNWHNSMIRMVAHLVAIGRTDAEILGLGAGITLPGYTHEQTLREMVSALRSARDKWSIPEPQDDVAREEANREDGDSVFSLLDLDELEALPPPTWLIEEMITDHGLSIIYGDPGTGKSFIALDMALRIAFGMDWHGVDTEQTGVLYIAGEGARGLGKRVKGWRREYAMEGVDAPFLLLPVAVQMLEPKDIAKLCRTIDAAKARAGFPIGLTIIDTVSRALAGQDENGQESMSLFVAACGDVQIHTGGAVIGVHHSGKDKEKGMRGSTVLLGACDASLKVTKSGDTAVLKTEKQKDAEEAPQINFKLKKIEWAAGFEKPDSTLIPIKVEAASSQSRGLSKHQCIRLLEEIDAAWLRKKPWSVSPQTKAQGRYLPGWMFTEFGVSDELAKTILGDWQQADIIEEATVDRETKRKGLCVLKRPEDW